MPALSPRQREVWRYLALGYSQADIAAALCISPHTVHNLCRILRLRLGVPDRVLLSLMAWRDGVITAEERDGVLPPVGVPLRRTIECY